MANSRNDRPVGSVSLGDIGGTEPVSRAFGGDRGTPLDRYYVEGFLQRHEADVRGRVLEIGESIYTRRFGGDRVSEAAILDVPGSNNPQATLVADLQTGEGVPSDAFDCIILTQTLHMVFDVWAAVATARRALAPGGVVLATVPGISQIDAYDGPEKWFWMMTQVAARRLFEHHFPPENVTVENHGNVLAATAFLQGLALEEMSREDLDMVDPLYPLVSGIRARRPR